MDWRQELLEGTLRGLVPVALLGLIRQGDAPPALHSPLRMQVYHLVLKHPGITVRDLARRAGMTLGGLIHHLQVLSAAKLVDTRRAGRRRLVYPYPAPLDESPEDRALLHEETSRRLALTIVEHPRLTVAELIARTGLSQRVVYYHAKRLLDAGMVQRGTPHDPRGLVATPKLYVMLGAKGDDSHDAPAESAPTSSAPQVEGKAV